MEKKYYNNFDGLRSISCLLIILLHIEANTHYSFFSDKMKEVFGSFSYLTIFFMMISSFCLCASYLAKFLDGNINIEIFYKKRYVKILPFLVVISIIAISYQPTIPHLCDLIVELPILHGLLPADRTIDMNGVTWFLGVIFIFYFIFPAFTLLLKNKRRAWIAFVISLLIAFVCENHYFTEQFLILPITPQHFFIYDLHVFILGGIFYLYAETLRQKMGDKKVLKILCIVFCIILTVLFYFIPSEISNIRIQQYKLLILFSSYFVFAISFNSNILDNQLVKFISGISLELYLGHMIVFRFCEKIGLPYWFGDSVFSYIFTVCIVICILTIGIICYKFVIKKISNLFSKRKTDTIDKNENMD